MTFRAHVAFLSPLPPTRSGIADASAALLPHLLQHLSLTLFVDRPDQLPPSLKQLCPALPTTSFPEARHRFDLPVYQLGNNTLHSQIYQLALRFPGIAVLHEIDLGQFLAHELLENQADFPAYVRELAYTMGPAGYQLGRQLWLNQPVNDRPPFNKRIMRRSLGIIVHNEPARHALKAAHPDRPVHHIPLLVPQQPDGSKRDELHLPPDAFLFAAVGQLNRRKQIEWCLQQFAAIRQTVPEAHFLLVGELLAEELDLNRVVAENALQGAVHHIGYVEDPADFGRWINASDVIVALRQPTLGETSAGAINGLAAGRPLIVFDHGWYGTLPDEAVCKVPPLAEAAFQEALHRFLDNRDLAPQMGAAARAYFQATYRPEAMAASYAAFIAEVLAC